MHLMRALCASLVSLGSDKVKNVRLCWAYTVLPHIRKAGRLVENLSIVSVASDMANTDDDPEVRRVLQEIRFDELSVLQASSVDSVVDVDFDEAMNLDKIANNDDSGIGSECGVSDPTIAICVDVTETNGPGSAASPTALGSADSPTDLASAGSPPVHSSEGRPTSPRIASPTTAQSAEGLALSNAQSRQDLTKPGLMLELDSPSKKEPQSPSSWSFGSPGTLGSPTVTSPSSPSRDFIEDKLVEQSEVERVMNATFAEHRLLIEAEEDDEEMTAGPSDLENVDELPSDTSISPFT